MIYFDNASTTKYKPKEAYDAAFAYLTEIGVSPGRGSYQLGISALRMLYQARCTVGRFFGLTEPDRVVFTKNSTEAINLLFDGFLEEGDHIIISCFEHNAVLRPLERMKRDGRIEYDIVAISDLSLSPQKIYQKYANKNTRMVAFTLASNLTGRIVFKPEIFRYFQDKGIITFLDASQGGGKVNLSMWQQGIDYLAFTGHKDLLAIPGVGGLCLERKMLPKPLIQGGTGIYGENYVNPDIFPEGFEAGTLNMPAIWSLKTSLEYIWNNKDDIQSKEAELIDIFLIELEKNQNVIIYDKQSERIPTFCFNILGISSDKVVSYLDSKGICVRGGIHCTIIAHEAIKTVETGAVRVSINYQNKEEEIRFFCDAIKELCG